MPTVVFTYIPNHADIALSELAIQYRDKPLAEGVSSGVGARAQTVEDALWAIYTQMGISPDAAGFTIAQGAQLDAIGKLIKFPRQGLNDTDYLALLRVYVRILVSSGGIEQILKMFEILFPSSFMTLQESFPAAFILHILSTPITNAPVLIQIIRKAKGGGIKAQLHFSQSSPSTTFTFDGTLAQAFDNGHWSGAIE